MATLMGLPLCSHPLKETTYIPMALSLNVGGRIVTKMEYMPLVENLTHLSIAKLGVPSASPYTKMKLLIRYDFHHVTFPRAVPFLLDVPLSLKQGLWRRHRGDLCKILGRAASHGAVEFGYVDGATDTLCYI